ncbi:MAG TPA: universal stress protein [Candidatus Binatia bacterium]|nr:universal stress protein [Candidatus Binatia bacterium]
MTERFVVATDGSSPSDAAVDLALSLASKHGAEVLFIHAIDDPAIFAATANMPFDPTPTLRALESSGDKLLNAAAERANLEHIHAETRLMHGDPVDAILSGAREWNADLIVIGTHGRRGLPHFFLGSTAERVLQRSFLPVLVTKQPAKQ